MQVISVSILSHLNLFTVNAITDIDVLVSTICFKKINLFILIGGLLIYNIVVAFAIH